MNSGQNPYTIERVSVHSFHDIQSLYRDCFGIKLSIEQLQNKYDTSSFGAKFLGYIAYDINRMPAAHYSVFPLQINYFGKILLAAQSGDTMTHPLHQKKGLFIELATLTYQLAESEGVYFVFGFPNENSLHGFKNKLKWQFFGEMQDIVLVNRTLPISGLAKTFPSLKWIYRQLLMWVFNATSHYKDSKVELSNHVFQIARNHTFYKHKVMNEALHCRLGDFGFWIKSDGWLYIGDITGITETNVTDFLKVIKRKAFLSGCRKVVLSFSQNSTIYHLFKQHASFKTGLPIGFLPLKNTFDFSKVEFNRMDYDTF